MTQGLQNQRTSFTETAFLSVNASLGEQGLGCRFVVLTLLRNSL